MRRTKAQIAQDQYSKEVDQYRFFILDIETNRVLVGYETKEDCKENQIDNDNKSYTKIVAKKSLINYNIDVEDLLNKWKQM